MSCCNWTAHIQFQSYYFGREFPTNSLTPAHYRLFIICENSTLKYYSCMCHCEWWFTSAAIWFCVSVLQSDTQRESASVITQSTKEGCVLWLSLKFITPAQSQQKYSLNYRYVERRSIFSPMHADNNSWTREVYSTRRKADRESRLLCAPIKPASGRKPIRFSRRRLHHTKFYIVVRWYTLT